MKTPRLLLALALASLSVSGCGDNRRVHEVSLARPGATPHFAEIPIGTPRLHLKYHFDPDSAPRYRRSPVAEHFPNQVFRLREGSQVWYGLYAFEGRPENGATFKAYYLNQPMHAQDPVRFIQMDYDTRSRRFKESILLPSGRWVQQEGTFEIVADTPSGG